jgi:hypothetical protein
MLTRCYECSILGFLLTLLLFTIYKNIPTIRRTRLITKTYRYRWTSLYAREKDSKNRLAYKKTRDDYKLEDRFQKKAISGLHIHETADKKTTYNEGRLYLINPEKRVQI